MYPSFHIFDTIVLLGLLNAVVFASVIRCKKPQSVADGILAAVLLIFGLLCAKILLHTLGCWEQPGFRYFPLGIDLWLQPLLFLYVLALTEPRRLQRSLVLQHLLLPGFFLAYAIVVYLCALFFGQESGQFDVESYLLYTKTKAFEDFLSIFFGFLYGYWAYQQLGKYQQWVSTYTSDTAIPTHRWLHRLLLASALVLLLLSLMLLFEYFKVFSVVPLQLFYFYLVALIYIFGFFGFRHQDFRDAVDLIYKKSTAVSNLEWKELLQKFETWLQAEQAYLQPSLKLEQCANALKCPPQLLSAAIQASAYKNFRDLVNHFRVETFKARISKSDLKKETIMGIAYDCGFNSEPSFYRIFKEKTGLRPTEFLRRR